MKIKFDTYEIEDFLLDESFVKTAKDAFRGENTVAWEHLLSVNPDKKAMMESAYWMINAMQIQEKEISEDMIQSDYEDLLEKIHSGKSSKKYLYWISTAAACLILLIGISYRYYPEESHKKTALFSQLNEMPVTSDQVQLIVGKDEKVIVEGNASIQQQQDGTLIVNSGEKVSTLKAVNDYVHLIVPNGKRSNLTFSDGTRIWINSGTKLIYPSRFSEKKREIYVDGEIYLEVAKDESKPFVVHSKMLDVKVLGTSFNLTVYQDDSFSDVVLVSGSVEVNTENKQFAKLSPNKCYHMENGVGSIENVDVNNYICWKDGFIRLAETPLANIFKRLSRYYNIKIVYDESLGKIRYNGKLSMDGSIEDALYNISLTEPIAFFHKDNAIEIRLK